MSIVTAVIPCYNAAAWLREAIDSVRAQTVPVAEIIVVDDSSSDDSDGIARAAGAKVLSTGGRFGPARARNLAAREATTPYLGFLDADDTWLPTHCEILLGLLKKTPAPAVAFGRIRKFNSAGDIVAERRSDAPSEDTLLELLVDNPIAQSSAIVDRVQFLEAGGYRESMRFAEDYDLWLRLAEQHPIVGADTVTCRYRVHSGQMSHQLPEMIRYGWEARLACRTRLQACGGYTSLHQEKLLQALKEDLRSAWVLAERESLESLASLADKIQGGPALQREIRTRIRLLPIRKFALSVKRLGGF